MLQGKNFIMTFGPLNDGHNQLEIFTVPLSKETYEVN